MKPTAGKLIRWIVSAGMIVLLVVFARRVNWHQTWESILAADRWPLALAAVANLASLALKGVRWWIFLRPLGVTSLGLALRATVAGAGLNNVLVANGGEAARIVFVARATHVPSAKVLAALTMERLFEFIGYFVILVVAAYLPDVPHSIARWRFVALIGLALLVGLMIYLLRASEGARMSTRVKLPAAASWMHRVREWFGHFFTSMAGVATLPRLLGAFSLTMISWALQVTCYHLVARAAHLPLPLVGSVCALLAANIGFLMRVTPGSVGVFQFIYALTAVGFGVEEDAAVAVAVLLQTLQVLPVTLLGVALAPEFVFKRRRSPREGEPDIEKLPPVA
ncbi:MAG: lysylphosphatidylglycerol synthase transmembrane domain-containing protein [Gemmatimonadaceae bacterium]